jgi:hypothetical protein
MEVLEALMGRYQSSPDVQRLIMASQVGYIATALSARTRTRPLRVNMMCVLINTCCNLLTLQMKNMQILAKYGLGQ